MHRDVGIELGAQFTRLYIRGRGVVLTASSVLAGGAIANPEHAERVLSDVVRSGCGRRPGKLRLLVCVPAGSSDLERRAVVAAVRRAGAGAVHLAEKPMVAAIGAGLPVTEPTASMVVDLGTATTEIAVLRLGGIAVIRAVGVGGDRIDEAIARYAREAHGLLLGDRVAEEVKLNLGVAGPVENPEVAEVRGRDLGTGVPRTVALSAEDVRRAIEEPVAAIVDAVADVLCSGPRDLVADIRASGVVLTGGGALLRGLAGRLSEQTATPVRVADDPGGCGARGMSRLLEEAAGARR